jgi:hypothetical protein
MFEMVIVVAALVRDHPADFKAGWDKAKARAELRDRYRHGLIDATTLMMEEAKYLTPQEQAAVRKVYQEWTERRERERAAKLRELRRAVERWKARGQQAPPPPPDMK